MFGKELTNNEKAKVYAMYWGNRIDAGINTVVNSSWIQKVTIGKTNMLLILTPLNKVSDDHLYTIGAFCFKLKYDDSIKIGRDYIGYLFLNRRLSLKESSKIQQFSTEHHIQIFQFLISTGYAVPLWFGVTHWANNKTALDLGLGILPI